ncbi:MAG: YigZ family protein [Eubacteriales bacterium]|nr:YigZ family protein [Eubacteriales bacterium]MDD3882747.1 YigZ family protein [Eubacteriales bacterium]MDD4512632.1 YigZ family protein [Eubacteriales bacterium]
MKPYITLKKSAQDEFTEKKSRFIGFAAPCRTEEEALSFLSSVRESNREARHIAYAYIIGDNFSTMRFSDDGEPGGTAGMPMLEILKTRKICYAAVAVVRYFGGILLGAGGLTRAYSHAAALAVKASGEVMMTPSARLILSCPYQMWDKLQYQLALLPVIPESPEYTSEVRTSIIVRADDRDSVANSIVNQTNGSVVPSLSETMYYKWDIESVDE